MGGMAKSTEFNSDNDGIMGAAYGAHNSKTLGTNVDKNGK
jgi:hypothetical protein